ncbi:MAG: hypothetical protein Q7T57_02500 [Dehalococcoidales bacterium]|nr:hypothetical protein [Dehalococcoidales bacterium]
MVECFARFVGDWSNVRDAVAVDAVDATVSGVVGGFAFTESCIPASSDECHGGGGGGVSVTAEIGRIGVDCVRLRSLVVETALDAACLRFAGVTNTGGSFSPSSSSSSSSSVVSI